VVIFNELEFDDPLEYIKNIFKEITNAYQLGENITIISSNSNSGYEKFKESFILIQAVF
jgi:hypothetical protein